MKIELKEIELEPLSKETRQRPSSKDDRISADKNYLVGIWGEWYFGTFTEVWYGWSFNNWGTSGMQLNHIDGPVYEVVGLPKLPPNWLYK